MNISSIRGASRGLSALEEFFKIYIGILSGPFYFLFLKRETTVCISHSSVGPRKKED